MMKNLIEQLKLTRLSYLLEVIEVRDFRSKIKAFNKIRQMKITKDMGLLILQEANFKHVDTYSDFNISLSLISLLFKDYYGEYSDKLYDIYPKLTLDSKFEVLNLLAESNNKSAIKLYAKLLVKYGKELNEIPIGNLSLNKENYSLLFPELFKVLKFEIKRNPILILLNDFINLGAVKESDFKKNKKFVQTSVINILKEACNYKFKKDEQIMQNKDYLNLRIYLEVATSLEFYVTCKDTKSYLEKLLKKKDNQLKLFILENYLKKGKDLSKINLTTIARDNLSRYPLYSFLKFYNLEDLMPKKYSNNKALSESDLYINYAITYKYEIVPEKMEFIDERIVNDHKYYIYKFETDFNYYQEIQDPATDYILKTTKLDKTIKENSKLKYIGISGGFNKILDPSLIEKNLPNLIVAKYEEDYEKIIEGLLPKKETGINPLEVKKKKEKLKKEKVIKEKSEEKKKFKLFKKKDKVKPVSTKEVIPEVEIVEEYKEPSLLRRIFSFNTLLLLVCFGLIGSAIVLYTYLNGMDILDLKKNASNYDSVKILDSIEINDERYKELNYNDIFKQGTNYYVLFYEKGKKSVYHSYLKTLLDNGYTFYFVNLKKDENKALYSGNPTGFVISNETLLKVQDGDYEFYVVGKTNILKELRDYLDAINKKKQEEEKKKKEEETAKKVEEKVSKVYTKIVYGEKIKKEIAKRTCTNVKKNNIDFYKKKFYNLNINFEKEE